MVFTQNYASGAIPTPEKPNKNHISPRKEKQNLYNMIFFG